MRAKLLRLFLAVALVGCQSDMGIRVSCQQWALYHPHSRVCQTNDATIEGAIEVKQVVFDDRGEEVRMYIGLIEWDVQRIPPDHLADTELMLQGLLEEKQQLPDGQRRQAVAAQLAFPSHIRCLEK